jgi:hypothetical protein
VRSCSAGRGFFDLSNLQGEGTHTEQLNKSDEAAMQCNAIQLYSSNLHKSDIGVQFHSSNAMQFNSAVLHFIFVLITDLLNSV